MVDTADLTGSRSDGRPTLNIRALWTDIQGWWSRLSSGTPPCFPPTDAGGAAVSSPPHCDFTAVMETEINPSPLLCF